MTKTQTSENNPIRVSWIDHPSSGRLGMTFLPGKKADGIFGRHDRTLATDAQALRDQWGMYPSSVFVTGLVTNN